MVDRPETFEDALERILAEMRDIMVARQNKYGPENVAQQGLYGVITRAVADKVARILNALQGRVVNGRVVLDPIESQDDETFEDGLFDAANYLGPIAIMVHRGWWGLPRRETPPAPPDTTTPSSMSTYPNTPLTTTRSMEYPNNYVTSNSSYYQSRAREERA